jgi:transglutaminase-like putative cysteine protease
VLLARTRMADGTYVKLADYSTVEVAPDASAGWPAFGGITERVMVMGGIEPGCVLETEYQITTKPGARPYLAADLQINNHYPVHARSITVTVPPGQELSPFVSGLPEDAYVYTFQQSPDGSATHRWDFAGLDGQPNEPQALPWQENGVRLAFTTAPDADTWVKQRLATVDAAASEAPLLSKLAQDWTKDENTDADKLSALQRKLAGSFNFVDFDVTWQPATPRPASEVINSSYGLPAESAAVLLALARAAGVPVQPALLVADQVWDDKAAQAAMISAYVVTYPGPDGLEIWHPHDGRIRRDDHWAGYMLLGFEASNLVRTRLPAWTSADDSHCTITGSITIKEDGKYTGKLSIKTAGLFVSPNELETADGQKNRVRGIVDHLLPGAKVADFTLKSLTDNAFEAEAAIESPEPLDKLHDCYELALAETPPALADVPVPLAYSRRLTFARLRGPFDDRIDLIVNWPEDWTVEAIPGGVEQVGGQWGNVVQTVSPTDTGLRLQRHIRITKRDLSPTDVVALRKPLNELRSDYARTLLLSP